VFATHIATDGLPSLHPARRKPLRFQRVHFAVSKMIVVGLAAVPSDNAAEAHRILAAATKSAKWCWCPEGHVADFRIEQNDRWERVRTSGVIAALFDNYEGPRRRQIASAAASFMDGTPPAVLTKKFPSTAGG
jgi:hypothetical protein